MTTYATVHDGLALVAAKLPYSFFDPSEGLLLQLPGIVVVATSASVTQETKEGDEPSDIWHTEIVIAVNTEGLLEPDQQPTLCALLDEIADFEKWNNGISPSMKGWRLTATETDPHTVHVGKLTSNEVFYFRLPKDRKFVLKLERDTD